MFNILSSQSVVIKTDRLLVFVFAYHSIRIIDGDGIQLKFILKNVHETSI